MSVTLDPRARDGFVVYSHAGDDWRACRDHVSRALGRVREIAPREGLNPTRSLARDPAKIDHARCLWREAIDPRGRLAEDYLNSRALGIDAPIAGKVLRWHSRTYAMLALFRCYLTGEPRAISRTFLDGGARKLERKFLGPVGGAAIMFDKPGETLCVAEGIETAMSARVFGLGPTWALGSAAAVAEFPALPGISTLHLIAENDEASARAVNACATRWSAAGRRVLITRAARPGTKDLNDLIRGDAA